VVHALRPAWSDVVVKLGAADVRPMHCAVHA
jgi:hypothetical protein